jgi:hypothetical protein
MVKKTRVWVYLPDYLEAVIKNETAGKGDQGSSTSAWIVGACDHYLKSRDHSTEKQRDQERSQHEQEIKKRDDMIAALENDNKLLTAARDEVRVSYTTLEERSKGQAGIIEELRARNVHNEGVIAELLATIRPLIPERTEHKPRWWEFWKGKG